MSPDLRKMCEAVAETYRLATEVGLSLEVGVPASAYQAVCYELGCQIEMNHKGRPFARFGNTKIVPTYGSPRLSYPEWK